MSIVDRHFPGVIEFVAVDDDLAFSFAASRAPE